MQQTQHNKLNRTNTTQRKQHNTHNTTNTTHKTQQTATNKTQQPKQQQPQTQHTTHSARNNTKPQQQNTHLFDRFLRTFHVPSPKQNLDIIVHGKQMFFLKQQYSVRRNPRKKKVFSPENIMCTRIEPWVTTAAFRKALGMYFHVVF